MARLVVLNWKMNPDSLNGARKLFKETLKVVQGLKGVRVVICPPTVFLSELSSRYRGKTILFGAQNVHQDLRGARTGEASVLMLKDARVRYVIIGHSERRALGESDAMVSEKVATTVRAGLTAIICVGEKERSDKGEHFIFLKDQLLRATGLLTPEELKKIVVAYEPVWAIGKGASDALSSRGMHEMSIYIRKILAEKYGRDLVEGIPILYGGSVEPENSGELMREGAVSGFLVGHTSLEPLALNSVLRSIEAYGKR